MRQLADDKDASVELALKPLQEKLAEQQQKLDATDAALKAAQAVRTVLGAFCSLEAFVMSAEVTRQQCSQHMIIQCPLEGSVSRCQRSPSCVRFHIYGNEPKKKYYIL